MSSVPQAPKPHHSLTNCFFTLRFFSRMSPPKKEREPPQVAPPCEGAEIVDRDWMAELRRSVKMLHFGGWEEKEAAAREMKRLAEEDGKRRRTMAELGVIPPLVAMVGSEVAARRRLAVRVLVELADGSFT